MRKKKYNKTASANIAFGAFKMELPAKVGRLPQLIGEPAGGSLTADQWLVLATIVGPLVVC